jgi:hypothetical protein
VEHIRAAHQNTDHFTRRRTHRLSPLPLLLRLLLPSPLAVGHVPACAAVRRHRLTAARRSASVCGHSPQLPLVRHSRPTAAVVAARLVLCLLLCCSGLCLCLCLCLCAAHFHIRLLFCHIHAVVLPVDWAELRAGVVCVARRHSAHHSLHRFGVGRRLGLYVGWWWWRRWRQWAEACGPQSAGECQKPSHRPTPGSAHQPQSGKSDAMPCSYESQEATNEWFSLIWWCV